MLRMHNLLVCSSCVTRSQAPSSVVARELSQVATRGLDLVSATDPREEVEINHRVSLDKMKRLAMTSEAAGKRSLSPVSCVYQLPAPKISRRITSTRRKRKQLPDSFMKTILSKGSIITKHDDERFV